MNENYIRCIAYQLFKSYDDDIMQVGRIAYWKAREAFDPEKPFSEFERFAAPRIRGAMIDYVRQQTPRGINSKTPEGREQIKNVQHMSWDDVGYTVDPEYDTTCYLHKVLDRAEDLSNRHKSVLRTYTMGSTLMEIGEQLGVTEGRACQLLREARDFIR